MGFLRRFTWGALFLAAGAVVAAGWMPGADGWETGPRVGVATLFIMLGVVAWGLALSPWIMRRTAKADGPGGNCPVGATCPCGHFNFKPRKACRQCGKATVFPV